MVYRGILFNKGMLEMSLRYYPCIRLDGLRRTTDIRTDAWCSALDFNSGFPRLEAFCLLKCNIQLYASSLYSTTKVTLN
jgi:hypothetical protein